MNFINTIDESVYSLIIKLMSKNMTAIMMFISYLGSAVTLITLTIAFIILLKNRKDSMCIALNLVLVFLLNRILKLIIARPRPSVLRLAVEDGYSFPSRTFYGINGILWLFNISDMHKGIKQESKVPTYNSLKFIDIIYRNKPYLSRSALFYRCNRRIYNSYYLFNNIYKFHI